MVGFVWCMTMGDKWSGNSVSMAYILDQIWELGNFPENLTSKSNEMKCHCRRHGVKITYSDCFAVPKGVTVTTNLCTVRRWRQLRRWISGNFSTVPFLFQNGPNFMAYFRGVLFHLSWVIIHHIKPTTYGYYHTKWF